MRRAGGAGIHVLMETNTRPSSSELQAPAERVEATPRRMAWVKVAGSVLILVVLLVAAVVAWL